MRDPYDADDDDGGLIENKGDHKYLRRIPWTGRKKKYRYVYDPRIAAKLPVSPSPGEKVRVPHGAQAGHYEVLTVKKMGNHVVADLRHDETGHRMLVRTDALHQLVQDVFGGAMAAVVAPSGAAPAKTKAKRGRRARPALEAAQAAHRRADSLPRERWKVLDIILDDNNIKDYDLSVRDQQYLAWQRGEGKKPAPLKAGIGLLDAFQAGGERKTRFCCLREAFNHAIANAKTWRQIEPALEMLRTVPGFQEVHMPSFVLDRHAQEQIEIKEIEEQAHAVEQEAERARYPDYTGYGIAYDPRVPEDDLLLEAVTYERNRPELPAERQPGEDENYEDEDAGGFFGNPFDPVVWLKYRGAIAAQRAAAEDCRRRARYDVEEAYAARWHDAEADRLEHELAEWRAGPGANEPEPEPEFVPWWKKPKKR